MRQHIAKLINIRFMGLKWAHEFTLASFCLLYPSILASTGPMLDKWQISTFFSLFFLIVIYLNKMNILGFYLPYIFVLYYKKKLLKSFMWFIKISYLVDIVYFALGPSLCFDFITYFVPIKYKRLYYHFLFSITFSFIYHL